MELTAEKGFQAVDRLADLGVRILHAGYPYEPVLLAAQVLVELWVTDADDHKLEMAEDLLNVTRCLVTEPGTSLQQHLTKNNEEECDHEESFGRSTADMGLADGGAGCATTHSAAWQQGYAWGKSDPATTRSLSHQEEIGVCQVAAAGNGWSSRDEQDFVAGCLAGMHEITGN